MYWWVFELVTFHMPCFSFHPLTLHVLLSRRWAFLCQSLTEINIAVQQLDEVGREVKLWSHIGGGHYVSVMSGFPCVDFRKWFQPRDQKDPKPTRKGNTLNLDQWVRMRKIVEAITTIIPFSPRRYRATYKTATSRRSNVESAIHS